MSEDIISLSSDSSRSSSPFIDVSAIFNETEKQKSATVHQINSNLSPNDTHILLSSPIRRGTSSSPIRNRFVHTLSESDSSETEISDKIGKCGRPRPNITNILYNDKEGKEWSFDQSPFLNIEDSVDLLIGIDGSMTSRPLDNINKQRAESKQVVKLTREQRLEEKQRKQKEKAEKKAEKLVAQELLKHIKPGNCIKYVTVVLDNGLVASPFSGTLIAAVQNSESKYEFSTQTIPLSVSWTRESPGLVVKEENDVVLIWQWELFIPAVKNHTLCLQIHEIKEQLEGKSISLVVYGLAGYYSYLKSKKRNGPNEPKAKRGKRSADGEDFPYISRKDIEEELIELQLEENCNHRFIDSPEDLGQLIVCITKAIAETPFKLEKQRREMEGLEWYATGDSRDCVAVDRNGNGMLRLWQQQLSQFNLAGHDTAQAIAAQYPSPLALVSAYDKCKTQKEAEELIKDIPVRRCQGPLSSSRRIGPELSKKLYTFFCSTNGDMPLSQEQ